MHNDNAIAINVLDATEALNSPDLLTAWDQFVQEHVHVNAVYASTAWIGHLAATTDSPVRVVIARNGSGRLMGIVPVRLREYPLSFDIAGRVLLRRKMPAAEILGSIPMLPEDPAIHTRMVARILSEWPNCASIYVDAIPADSFFWKYLHSSQGLASNCYLHVADGPRPWHFVQLAPSFDDYLKTMSSKARSNIRREARLLGESAGGEVQACCVTSPDQVTWLLECAGRISRKSWQHRVLGERIGASEATRRSFEDLATRRILRSYVLQAGEIPCAFAIGYQYLGVFHYVEIGFDERYSRQSPGKVLLSLIIEDLHKQHSFQALNFGVGDSSYKRRFGNCERSDASCLILRKQFANAILTRSHTVFNGAVVLAKKLIGRRVER